MDVVAEQAVVVVCHNLWELAGLRGDALGGRLLGRKQTLCTVQKTGDIFIVLSAGTTGMRTDCRTPEGIRQDVAPLFI